MLKMEGNISTKVKSGDKVKVNYTLKLDDETVLESTPEDEPLEFTTGEQKVIPGFEEALFGMSPGESKTVELEPEEAYGPRRDELIFKFSREELPDNIHPEVGQQLRINKEGEQEFLVTVVGLDDSNIELDANHPLAGKTLTFDIELLEIE